MKSKNIYFYLIYLFIFILAISLWFKQDTLSVHFSDMSFHMANAHGFKLANGPVTWNFWEANPEGRPNNYPPIFHIFLATLLKIGISIDLTSKLAVMAVICIGMLFFALGLRKLFNEKIAFFTIIPLITSLRFISISSMILPATFVLFLSPWLIYFFKQKKYVSLCGLALLMLYTHMIMPTILIGTLIIWAIIFERKNTNWKKSLIALFVSYILYLPWLIPLLINGKNYIKYFNNTYQQLQDYNTVLNLNLLVYTLAIAGIILLIHKKSKLENKNVLYYFLFLLIIFSPISLQYSSRAENGHSYVMASIFAGVFLSWLITKKYFRGVTAGLCVILLITTITLQIYLHKKMPNFIIERSAINWMWFKEDNSNTFSKEIDSDLINVIRNNSKENETIAVLMPNFLNFDTPSSSQIHIANYLSVRADRSNVNMRLPELYFRDENSLANARILITSQEISVINEPLDYLNYEKKEQLLNNLIQNYSLIEFIPFENFNTIYIYKNNSENVIEQRISKSKIPFWLADFLILSIVVLIVWDGKREK